MASTASMPSTARTAGRVIWAGPTGSIPATRDTRRLRPPCSRPSARDRPPSSVRCPPHHRFRTSFGRIPSRPVQHRGGDSRSGLEDLADLQRKVQCEPDFGVAQVNAEQLLDPAQSIEHRVAMEVEQIGRFGGTAVRGEVGPERLEQEAAAVLYAQPAQAAVAEPPPL